MSPRHVFLAALVFALSVPIYARDLRPELDFRGRAQRITISPAGDLWIGTMMGYLYRSDDGGRSWSEVVTPARRIDYEKTFFGDDLDRITFFDEKRAIVSGYIGEHNDQILRTEDAGLTWKSVQLPVDGFWVYEAQAKPDGHAWLVGSSGVVLRSDDYGRTWRELAVPFDDANNERTLSVWFDTPQAGVVGSLSSGLIAITRDGGATWRPFEAEGGAEIVRGCGKGRDHRVTRIRIRGGKVIVAQCDGVFAAPLAEPRRWTRVIANGKPLIHFELADNGNLIGVTETLEVHEIAIDGGRSLGKRLEKIPVDVAVSGERIALFDPTDKVTAFDGDGWVTSRMFGKGVATSWPIQTLDRGANDVLWGISRYFLYRSNDGGKTWDRITEFPVAAEHIYLQRDGNVLIADRHGWVSRWDVRANRLVDVPVLKGLDIVGSFRRDDLWLLFGGRQYDTAGRVEVAQTFFSGQFAGSVNYGFVAASVDGGTTWKIIDRWKEEGPQAIFLSDDNRLTLLSWLCGIRQGTITREPLGARMQTLISGSDRDRTPYVQEAHALELIDGKNGWLLGWTHHLGDLVFRTSDGGRRWTYVESSTYPRVAVRRMFDGTWIGVALPSTLQRWNGKQFETLVDTKAEIFATSIDSEGSLVVRFKDGSIRVLDPGSRTLRTLREQH